MSAHLCPKNGCGRPVPRSQLACRTHWFAISVPVRKAVWDAFRSGDHAAHRAAMRAAIEELNPRQAPC